MSNPSFVPARRALLTACAATLITMLSACASAPAPISVADTITKNPNLSTFNGLINASGVAQTLQTTGPFTVFAPSNEAFQALPAKTLEDLKSQPEKLANLVKYHVIPGSIAATSVAQNTKVKALNGNELEISKAGEFMTVESAIVTQADIIASNGLVQILDTVLLPPAKK
jgi:uncharacterized surface protein with fasciclin (FAS1) repeats